MDVVVVRNTHHNHSPLGSVAEVVLVSSMPDLALALFKV
ncbi:hypothetical protein JCM19238_5459 [Vibrio ponticus]|nr:hypothetical protein JCM19238_5459 [Vibrio ponticus]